MRPPPDQDSGGICQTRRSECKTTTTTTIALIWVVVTQWTLDTIATWHKYRTIDKHEMETLVVVVWLEVMLNIFHTHSWLTLFVVVVGETRRQYFILIMSCTYNNTNNIHSDRLTLSNKYFFYLFSAFVFLQFVGTLLVCGASFKMWRMCNLGARDSPPEEMEMRCCRTSTQAKTWRTVTGNT